MRDVSDRFHSCATLIFRPTYTYVSAILNQVYEFVHIQSSATLNEEAHKSFENIHVSNIQYLMCFTLQCAREHSGARGIGRPCVCANGLADSASENGVGYS